MNIDKSHTKKNILIGISVFLIYLLINEMAAIPFYLLKIDTENLSNFIIFGYSLIVNILALSIIMLIYHKILTENFKDFKENHKTYFKTYIKYWFWVLGLTMFSNLIIQIIQPNSIAGNEEQVRKMLEISPIYIFTSAVIIAPLLEELIFRQSFRYIFKNDTLFLILSGLVFGSFHVIGNVETIIDALYIVPYSIPGVVFAYTLLKSKNIFVPISLHFIHNGILVSLQIFLSFFI